MHFLAHRFLIGIAVAFALVFALALDGALTTDVRADSATAAPISLQTCEQFAGGKPFARTQLYFGLSQPRGSISEQEFQDFIAKQVTPRFPDGLTLLTGKGQYLDARGAVTEEGSKLLILFYVFDPAKNRAIEDVRQAYKTAFHQESVLRVDEQTCVSY